MEMASKVARFKELSYLDLSSRVDISLSKEDSPYEQSEKIYAAVQSDIVASNLLNLAWEEFVLHRRELVSSTSDIDAQVSDFLDECGLKEVMVDIVQKIYEKNFGSRGDQAGSAKVSRKSSDEVIDCIRESRMSWERGISEELSLLVREAHRPFVMNRPLGATNPHLEEDNTEALDTVRFLFDSEDLLETASAIVDDRMCVSERTLMMGMMKIKISTPSLSDLMERFSELSVLNIQYGLDDINPKYGNRFSLLRQEEGEHVISRGVQSEARIFLRNGVTPSLRQKLWRLALGLTPATTEEEEARYATLRHQCDEYDVLTDEMFLLDVQSVADDHRFFPFGDVIRDLVLCFSRDRMQCAYEVHPVQIRDKKRDGESDSERNGSEYEGEGGADNANRAGGNRRDSGLHRNQQDDAVIEDRNGNGDRNRIDHGSSSSSSNFKSSDKNGLNTSVGTNRNITDVITIKSNVLSATDSESISRPLHSERKENGGLDTVPDRLSQGTQPFLGFASYIAPLCYLCTDKPALYSLASNMWSTVWCKLNVLTGDDGALLHICKTFENLLAFLDQKLFLHLLSIGIEPLKVAFPWLQMAFVGFFEIDQLLILWDRVLGFHDLTIFSLLAVAIFTSRSQPILLCESPEAATVILNEGSRLKVIPLLQMILYAEK